MPDALVLALVATVVPASVVRLWWIWWLSGCVVFNRLTDAGGAVREDEISMRDDHSVDRKIGQRLE